MTTKTITFKEIVELYQDYKRRFEEVETKSELGLMLAGSIATLEKLYPELKSVRNTDDSIKAWLIGFLKGNIGNEYEEINNNILREIGWLKDQNKPIVWGETDIDKIQRAIVLLNRLSTDKNLGLGTTIQSECKTCSFYLREIKWRIINNK